MNERYRQFGQFGQHMRRPSALSVWLKRLAYSLLTLIVLGLIAAGSAIYIIDKRGGIVALIDGGVSDALPGAQTDISELTFTYDVANFNLIVNMQGAGITYHEQHLRFEDVKLIFGLLSLRTALPVEIHLRARSLTVERQEQAVKFSDEFRWLNQIFVFDMPATPEDRARISAKQDSLWPSGLQRLTLIADDFTVLSVPGSNTDSKAEADRFTDLRLSFWPTDKGKLSDQLNMSLRLSQPVQSGQIVPQINLSVSINFLSALSVFDLKAKHVDLSGLLRMADRGELAENQIISDADMEVKGTFDGRTLSLLSGKISSSSGSVFIPKADNPITTLYTDLHAEFDYSAAEQMIIIHNLSAQSAGRQTIRLAGKLTRIHSDEIGFTGTMLGEDISIAALQAAWPEEQADDARRWISQHMTGGRFKTLAIEFEGGMARPDRLLAFSQLNLSGEYANIRLSYSDDQYQTVVGTLKGALDVKMGADGKLQSASVAMSVRNGFMRVAGFGPTIRVASVDLVLRQQGGQTILQNLSVDLKQSGQLTLSGIRKKTDDIFISDVTLAADRLDIELFQHLWPRQVASNTIAWMHHHILSGEFGKSQLDLKIVEQDNQPKLISVTGDVLFSKAEFQLYQGLVPAKDLSGLLKFEQNTLTVNVEQGIIDQLSVSQAQIDFAPLFSAGREHDLGIRLNAAGDVGTLLSVLGHAKINQLDKFKLNDKQVAGRIEFSMNLAAVASPGKRLAVTDFAFNGSMTEAAIRNLPMRHDLEQGNLVLTYQQGNAQLSGTGLLTGMKADFSYQTSSDGMSLTLKTANDPAVTAFLKERYNLPVDQAMKVKLTVTGQPREALYKVGITADATDTSLSFPVLGWAKLPGEAATANMQLIFKDGQLNQIEAIDIYSSSLKAKGRVALNSDLSVNHGYLEQVVLPGHRIDTMLLERDKNGVMNITAEGDQIDLIPLRRREGLAKGRDLKFDITSEHIVLGQDITFSGHLEGQLTKQSEGEARLHGSLNVKGNPLLSEGSVEALFGAQGEFLSAVGVIGGAEAELTYSPSDTGETILLITSKNGGRILDGLKITDAIRGGDLRLATTFAGDDLSVYQTEIELVDFHVVEAPKAVRAFSVLSVAGLSSLVEGEGTHFSKGQAVIEADGDLVMLKKVRAVGEAVGVHLLGTYDRQSRQVDVSGDLVPLKQLSKLIGYVPFFGELLTGIDKTGIFSTQFTVKGGVDDPDVGINLFALAPGLLRDILSPDWLGGERRRILGIDEQGAAAK